MHQNTCFVNEILFLKSQPGLQVKNVFIAGYFIIAINDPGDNLNEQNNLVMSPFACAILFS